MKKTMILAAVCLGAAMTLPAQDSLRVNLPVASKIGNVTLPAGSYTIHELKNSVIEITSDAQKGVSTFAAVTPVVSANGVDHSKVVLRKEDNGSFDLQSIWLEGQDMGLELTAAE